MMKEYYELLGLTEDALKLRLHKRHAFLVVGAVFAKHLSTLRDGVHGRAALNDANVQRCFTARLFRDLNGVDRLGKSNFCHITSAHITTPFAGKGK